VTKPTIGDLLNGVAISLRESVLPEIPAGPTRRQIQVAISIIRRVSGVWDKIGPYLFADNRDMEETLRQVCGMLERAEANGTGLDLEPLRQRLHAAIDRNCDSAAEYPSPAALAERNVELQGLLVELQENLHQSLSTASAERTEIAAVLRMLFRRILERELAITALPARN
jgi:hypothetical protein